MISIALHQTRPGVPRSHAVLAEPVLAAIAVHAARRVPGVLRVEPGVAGLIASVGRATRQRLKGLSPASTEGVRVTVERPATAPPLVRVEVSVTVSGSPVEVGPAVQRAVTAAVADHAGVHVTEVCVSIVDIELPEVTS